MKEIKDKIYISVFNKIKPKQILLQSIFPFTDERPFIFPYIINEDQKIKKNLTKVFSSLQKHNSIPGMNTIIYKFVSYRLLSETKISDYYELHLNWGEKEDWDFGDIDMLFEVKNKSLIDYLKDILMGNFNKKEKDSKVHIKKEIIECYIQKGKQLNKFIKDYFSIKDTLFLPYDSNFEELSKELLDFLIDAQAYDKKIIIHKKYSEDNYKKYLKTFIDILKEHDKNILNSFPLLLVLKFDGIPFDYKLHLKKVFYL